MESINYPTRIEKASFDLAQVQRETATLRERRLERLRGEFKLYLLDH